MASATARSNANFVSATTAVSDAILSLPPLRSRAAATQSAVLESNISGTYARASDILRAVAGVSSDNEVSGQGTEEDCVTNTEGQNDAHIVDSSRTSNIAAADCSSRWQHPLLARTYCATLLRRPFGAVDSSAGAGNGNDEA